MKLEKRKRYLQISFNNNLSEAQKIIQVLPPSDRILIEAGTPLIMRYGVSALIALHRYLTGEPSGGVTSFGNTAEVSVLAQLFFESFNPKFTFFNQRPRIKANLPSRQLSSSQKQSFLGQYLVADIKCADLADKEIDVVSDTGASAATCLGVAPIETIDNFIQKCRQFNLDSIIDMINVEEPLSILGKLQSPPDVVVLHRGVDELAKENKKLPYYQIKKIKGSYDVLVAVAGADTLADAEEAFFNDADIVILWKAFYTYRQEAINLVNQILSKIS